MPDPSKPKLVNETPYSQWSAENIYDDEVESYGRYADHLRGEYLSAGAYTPEVEQDLRGGLKDILENEGLLGEDTADQVQDTLESIDKPSLFEEATLLADNIGLVKASSEDKDKILSYVASQQAGGDPDDALDPDEISRLVKENRRDVITDLYNRGEILAGVYEDEDGNETFLGGKLPNNITESEVIKNSSAYGVKPRHLFNLQNNRQRISQRGNLRFYEIKERQKVEVDVDEFFVKTDDRTKAQLQGLAVELGKRKSWDFGDKAWDNTGDFTGDIWRSIRIGWNDLTGDDEEELELRQKERLENFAEAAEDNAQVVKATLVQRLVNSTGYDAEVLEDVVDDYVTKLAFYGDGGEFKPTLKFTDDEDELSKNVIKTKYNGVLIQRDLQLKPEMFKKALAGAGLSEEEIAEQETFRAAANEGQFDSYNKVLSADEDHGDDWQRALVSGKLKGLTNGAILEKFVREEDVSFRGRGVWTSIKQSFSTLGYGVAAMFGSEWGQDGLVENERVKNHNREIAGIFGIEMGTFQEMAEQVAPMLTDAVIGGVAALAAAPTFGASAAGGAAYFSAKTSATAVARGIIKESFKGTLKRGVKRDGLLPAGKMVRESLEDVRDRIIKNSTLGPDVTGDTIMAALKGYNGRLGSKMGVTAATFVPAATRSGSMTYGSVFSTMTESLTAKHKDAGGEWHEGWSEKRVREEAHEVAFDAGLQAGTTTGLLTAGMGRMFGGKLGGLENTFLKGLSYRQTKVVASRLLGKEVNDAVFQKALKTSVREVMVENGMGVLKEIGLAAAGEGVEEGLDEFINSLIQDAYTGQDTPLKDRLASTVQGIVLGGLMGAGSPVLGRTSRNVAVKFRFNKDEARLLQDQVLDKYREKIAEDTSLDEKYSKLYDSGAPQTAEAAKDADKKKQINEKYNQPENTEADQDAPQDQQDAQADEGASEQQADDQESQGEQDEEVLEQLELIFANTPQEQIEKTIDDVASEAESETTTTVDPEVAADSTISKVLNSDETVSSKADQASVTSPHPANVGQLTARQKHSATLADIERKTRRYQEEQAKISLLEGEALEKAERVIDQGVEEGKLHTPETASFSRKEADKVLEQDLTDESKPKVVSEKDISSLGELEEAGFPVTLIKEHLNQFDLDLDSADPKYLSAVTNKLATAIKKRFPLLKKRMPKGGARVPSSFGSTRSVFIDADGNGVFNNDPQSMLTLLQNGIPIPMTDQDAGSTTINPSFKVETVAGQKFVTDVLVPVSGGFVSARTAFNKVGVHQADYRNVVQLITLNKQLRESGVENREGIKDKKFTDPLNPRRKATLKELLKDAKDIGKLKGIIANDDTLNLNKDYVDAMAVSLSLTLQNRLYSYGVSVVEGNAKSDVPYNIAQVRDNQAKFYRKQQAERATKSRRDLAAIISPNSTVLENPTVLDVDASLEDAAIPPRVNPIAPIPQAKLQQFLGNLFTEGSEALRDNSQLRAVVKGLLDNKLHGGKKSTRAYSPEKTFEELVFFLARGGNISTMEAVQLNDTLKQGQVFGETGTKLRRSLMLLGISTPTVEGSPQSNLEFGELVKGELQKLVGKDTEVTINDARDFYKQVRNGAAVYRQRAIIDGRSRRDIARKNYKQIEELGLVEGNPETVIDALEQIAKGKVKQLRLAAEAILQNKDLIRSVRFEIDASAATYAGLYYRDANGQPVIVINPNRSGGRGVADTLVHEYLHAFTTDIINADPASRTPSQNEAVAGLSRLLEVIKREVKGDDPQLLQFGTENLDEFLAYLLTAPKFQNFVRGIRPRDGGRNYLHRLFDFIAKIVRFPNKAFNQAISDAFDLTKRAGIPDPESQTGFVNQVAGSISGEQTALAQMADDMGMAETAQSSAALERAIDTYKAWARNYLPDEIGLVFDETSDVIVKTDPATGAIIMNPRRAAIKLAQVVSENELDPMRREHILASLLNEEMAHTASFATLTDTQIAEIASAMTEEDYNRILDEYYPIDERAEARERLFSEDPVESSKERYILVEESLRSHAQKVMRGTETNAEIDFLLTNPSLMASIKQYFKNLIAKLTYHRTLNQVSPEMKVAVMNVVREIRAIEMGYATADSNMDFNPRNPQAIIDQLIKQAIGTNSLVKDTPEPVVLDSRFGAGELLPVNTAQTEVDDALLNGRDDIDTGIKGSAVHELAKFMDRLMPTKEKIDWQKNWRGKKKSFKDIPQKEKAFNRDIERSGTRIVGVLQRALNEYPEFVSWYEERVSMAMDIFAELDPDAAKPQDDFILKVLMTVTSNGNKVKEQTEDSWALYQNWKKTGRLVPATKNNPDRTQLDKDGKEVPISWMRGDRQSQIKDHLALVDKLIAEHSWETVSEFFAKSGTRKELISDLQETFGFSKNKAEKLTGGELMDEQVPYSLVFGAKLGSFYNNLNGDFETITMDRWFMRTFGRTLGTQLRKYNREEMAEKHERFDKALAAYLKLDPKAALFKFADSQRTDKTKLDPIGRKRKRNATLVLALAKHYTKSSNRQFAFDPETGSMEKFSGEMEKAAPITNELRLATNGLSKAIDSFELIEAPASGGHRRFIRLAMRNALAKLEKEQGIKMVPAEAQAILWYYEKALHAEYGSGQDGEAPDYATSANEVFKESRGTSAGSFRESTANIRGRGIQQSPTGTTGGTGLASQGDIALESRFGADSYIPAEIDVEGADFSNWLEILEVPLMDFAKYDAPSTLKQIFARKADKRVIMFLDQTQAFIRETKKIVKVFQDRANKVLDEEEKRGVTISPRLISIASGSNMGTQLSDEQKALVDNQFKADLAKARGIPEKEKAKVRQQAEDNKKANITRFREQNHDRLIAERNAALEDLLVVSPSMYEIVVEMRKLVDQLSKSGETIFDGAMDRDDFKAAFDFNRGIYITRRYRMFEEPNFINQVLNEDDDTYVKEREAAIQYFARRYKAQRIDELMEKEGLTKQDARKRADDEMNQKDSVHLSEGKQMMENFVRAYAAGKVRREIGTAQSVDGASALIIDEDKFPKGPLKSFAQELNEKKDIPEPIRKLLGEYGAESGLDNLAYTVVHTASVMANQSFFNKMKKLGTESKEPWLLTAQEFEKLSKENPSKYAEWSRIAPDKGQLDLNPLKGLYAPDVVISNLNDLIKNERVESSKAAQDDLNKRSVILGKFGAIIRKATGYSLAYKTLGGVGFYGRNFIGNALFFGPMQGYYGGIGKAIEETKKAFTADDTSFIRRAAQGSKAELDFAMIELATMNVFGDELEVNLLQSLLKDEKSYKSLEDDTAKAGGLAVDILKLMDAGKKTVPESLRKELKDKGFKVGRNLKETHDFLLEFGSRMASAADAYYKVGLYDYELSVLKEAGQWEIQNGKPDGRYARLLDKDGKPTTAMKQMAAEIVKDTAQSYSRAIPIIKDITRSNLSVIMAPFIRFAADVPRVALNGFLRIGKEKNDSNPIIQARGKKRKRGFIGMNATIAVVPIILRALQGIGEDEDEALRASLPPYMKDNTFFYTPNIFKGEGTWSWDFTYLNPFAIIQDPLLRMGEELVRGNVTKGGSKVFNLLKPYLQEQILAKAVYQMVVNKSDYGDKITYDGEPNVILKRALYAANTAFAPRSLKALNDAQVSLRSDETELERSPFGIFLKEVAPVKPYPMDPLRSYRSYLKKHMEEYRGASKPLSRLVNTKGMTKGQIQRLYNDYAKTKIYQNNQLRRIMRGFKGLGVTSDELRENALSRGISKKRYRQVMTGFTDRPILTKPLESALSRTSQGRERLKILKSYYETKYPKPVISLGD